MLWKYMMPNRKWGEREGGGEVKQSFMTSKTPPGIEKFENVLTAR
jgi:hypothetical protein